jgi:hypothetical protein
MPRQAASANLGSSSSRSRSIIGAAAQQPSGRPTILESDSKVSPKKSGLQLTEHGAQARQGDTVQHPEPPRQPASAPRTAVCPTLSAEQAQQLQVLLNPVLARATKPGDPDTPDYLVRLKHGLARWACSLVLLGGALADVRFRFRFFLHARYMLSVQNGTCTFSSFAFLTRAKCFHSCNSKKL